MKINNKEYKTVWMEKSSVIKIIEQNALPYRFRIINLKDHKDCCKAIKTMMVRGAPAIGAVAAFAMAQAAINSKEKDYPKFKRHMEKVKSLLRSTRPTAYELFFAVNKVESAILKSSSVKEAGRSALKAAREYSDTSEKSCKNIGIYGEKLIRNNFNILTHCNAGSLATVNFGTALAPITLANSKGKKIHVFVDETRPRLQGSRLTAFELENEKVPFSVIADNAAGHYMFNKKIDMCIVGADRIAMNGDVANKIGTYEKAVLAHENNIPFYVAAPVATFDTKIKDGKDIKIEERDEKEVLFINKKKISSKDAHAKNPAFDITPAKYITGIITEYGIIKANKNSIKKLITSKKRKSF